MSLAQLFYAKQAYCRAMRWVRQWRQQRRTPHPTRSFMIEPLEPRLLMSANPATLATVTLTNAANLQPAIVEGAQFPPGAFAATGGSRLHESFTTAGEVDAFYFDATAGQHMALELMPHASAIQGRVEILDPNGVSIGSVDAGTAGGYVLLQDKVLSQTGRYTIEFESLNGTGTYDGNVFVGTTALPTVAATTNNWINAAGGNWSVGANWSRGVAPTTVDIVGVTLDGTYTVTMDVSSTITGLVLGGSLGTQSLAIGAQSLSLSGINNPSLVGAHGILSLSSGTLSRAGEVDINGAINWAGGTIGGTGFVVLGQTGTMAVTGNAHTLIGTFENQGTTTWSASNITMSGSTFLNKGSVLATTAPSTTLSMQGGVTGGTNSFINQGILQKQGTGTLGVTTSSTAVNFDNSGLVDVQAGTFNLEQGSASHGQFNIASGATVAFSGGRTYTFLTGTTVTGPGAVQVNNDNLVVNADLSIANLSLSSGSVGGTGTLTLMGASTWSGGTLSGTGRTLIASTGSLDITSGVTLSRVLENQGTATWTAGGLQFNSGQLLNTGTFSANSAGTLQAYGTGGTNNRFTNQGIFRKQGVGTVSIQ
ncbi:LEPR-XLL domain-containing protein, partial [Nitrospira lenta]|uniref:LEPR-XLL domain-containing protein n=1 Tax=Nitrospira lenta TaxID=1436998 RepID=UPI000EFD9767